MPRKIRQLIAELKKAGFINHQGKGSHRKFFHPDCDYPVVISGKLGDDVLPYQEKAVKTALLEVQK